MKSICGHEIIPGDTVNICERPYTVTVNKVFDDINAIEYIDKDGTVCNGHLGRYVHPLTVS